ncbi:hypothetical protein LG329_04560 [Virgibacillus necropolis]|uniref:hypothetical protein n=1 Tax=Virgibacillus necropolis TaxID=163877 RepID=UPI00384D6DC6
MIDAKKKAIIFLSIAFILALVTTALVLNELREAKQSLGEMVEVAVAEQDIAAYTDYSSDIIKWVEIPKNEQSSSFVQKEDMIENSVVLVNVKEGNVLTKNIIRSKVDIDPNHRVVWLNATDNVIIDQKVVEGDLVDIIVSLKEENNVVKTSRVLESLKVVQREELPENQFAIKVSLPVEDAATLIHYQNYAKQIRALRVSQVTQKKAEESQVPEDNSEETSQKEESKETSKEQKPDKKESTNQEKKKTKEKNKN